MRFNSSITDNINNTISILFSGPSRGFGSDALGHAGTRRTVYYTDDSPPSSASLPVRNNI